MPEQQPPDLMPVLSRGRHRSPRKGACFMELASYLAGERWSDHPRCTHPLLASVAREVNDSVGDDTRRRLSPLIPDVIGLTSHDPRVEAWIAREAACLALPHVSAERQDVLAVGLLAAERHLATLDGRDVTDISAQTRAALQQAPLSGRWAERFTSRGLGPARSFDQRSAAVVVHAAVRGLAEACVPDPDALLVSLLDRAIGVCRERFGAADAPRPAEETWRELCSLTAR